MYNILGECKLRIVGEWDCSVLRKSAMHERLIVN